MSDTIKLAKGEVYFLVGFNDPNLTIPTIHTCIYEGIDSVDDEQHHLFLSVDSSASDTQESEEGESHYICFELGRINGILDKKHLIEWLAEEHSPRMIGRTYEYRMN